MPRTIIQAEAAGFCFGVKKAIARAEASERSYIFGSLIHNPQEVARLDAAGKKIVKSLDEVEGKEVMITAHGLDIRKIEEMRARGLGIVDTTCPLVTRIYLEGGKLERQGLRVVIVGDPDHVEVKGIASRMKDPIIVYADEDLEKVPSQARIGVISQSTLMQEKFAHFAEALKARCAEVVVVNTICKPTKDRQNAVHDLARQVDVMVVVGGFNSSNTKKLADVAKGYLGAAVHHIETAEALDPAWFEGKQRVGVTAGTSTPDYIIQAVIRSIAALDGATVSKLEVEGGEV